MRETFFPNEGKHMQTEHTDVTGTILKWTIIVLVSMVVGMVLAGCNTVAGLGKDLQAAAKGIQSEMSEEDDPYAYAGR